ncbi:MAG: phosphatase PAP2 family protein, partial [Bacteroidota bacterium]
DQALFEFIHYDLANPFLDAVLPIYREKTTWIPLYLLMVYLLWRQYGGKRTLWLLLCIAVTLTVADQLAASVIKPWVGRARPCATDDAVRELVSCGGIYSFPSNHATNHFALAMVLNLTWLAERAWSWRLAIFVWAATIALAQVYVGKHYPADIIVGAALGMLIALGGVTGYRRFTKAEAIGPR